MNPDEKELREEAPAGEPEQAAISAASPPVAAAAEPVSAPEEPEGVGPEGAGGRVERGRDAPPDRRRRQFGRRKVCAFCVENVRAIDYKDAGRLRRYLSDRGRIEARRKTGTCAKHQRWLALALKRARHLALLPYTAEHIRVTGMFAPRR